jgi:hypothetical protein
MAGMTSFTTRSPVAYGRSGYNKDGDDEEDKKCINFGRSGYNKDGDDDEEDKKFVNFGRSGYNK